MPTIPVAVKHAGKTHQLQLDTDAPATTFKNDIYQVTGVPPDRMKVMIKGGVLKVCLSTLTVASPVFMLVMIQDDTDWRKVGPKPVRVLLIISDLSLMIC